MEYHSGMGGAIKDQKKKNGRPRSEPKTEFGRWYPLSCATVNDIRDELQISRSYVYELIRGERVPSLQVAIKLIDMSRGLRGRVLKPEDFLPDDPG